MKLLSRDQIESLAKFKSKDFLTTSFFLDTSKNRMSKKEIQLSLKNLLNSSKLKMNSMSLPKDRKESLVRDLDHIKDFCMQNLPGYNDVGLAIFSCSRMNFWQDFNLVKSPRNLIIFDQGPYVRPLSAILDEYHRICVLTIDRKEALWYDVYMGEISLLDTMTGDVPSKVKEGGWEGYSSKRIERHIASRLHDFFKKAAQKTFDIMKQNNFDWLFLGCQDEYCQEITPLFHPYVKERMKSRVKLKPADSESQVLKETLSLKTEFKKQEKTEIVQNFIAELEKGGLAVSGLKETLRKLNRSEVQTLLVTRHFSKPGKKCPRCRFLYAAETVCPTCQVKTEAVIDIIDEAVETAMDSRCQVRHINPPSRLSRYGSIGAFLRFKT